MSSLTIEEVRTLLTEFCRKELQLNATDQQLVLAAFSCTSGKYLLRLKEAHVRDRIVIDKGLSVELAQLCWFFIQDMQGLEGKRALASPCGTVSHVASSAVGQPVLVLGKVAGASVRGDDDTTPSSMATCTRCFYQRCPQLENCPVCKYDVPLMPSNAFPRARPPKCVVMSVSDRADTTAFAEKCFFGNIPAQMLPQQWTASEDIAIAPFQLKELTSIQIVGFRTKKMNQLLRSSCSVPEQHGAFHASGLFAVTDALLLVASMNDFSVGPPLDSSLIFPDISLSRPVEGKDFEVDPIDAMVQSLSIVVTAAVSANGSISVFLILDDVDNGKSPATEKEGAILSQRFVYVSSKVEAKLKDAIANVLGKGYKSMSTKGIRRRRR